MHEYGITEQIIKIAEQEAKKSNAKKVTKIHLVIGELSGFIGDSIQLYFDIMSKDSICEGAQLEINYINAKLKCPKCNLLFERQKFMFECPECGELGELTDIGKECYVKSIEIE